MYGVGGAGALSSGTINLRPDIGGDLHKLVGNWKKAEELISYIDNVFLRFGAPKDRLFRINKVMASELERLAAEAGAKFIPTPQRHIGSDNTVKVIESMAEFLESNGVKFLLRTQALDLIREDEGKILVKTSAGNLLTNYVVLAPGRGGAAWFAELARKRGISIEPGPLDIGVRVEIPYYIAEPLTRVARDPKIIMYTKSYDDKVRTFCTNPRGFVIEERYDDIIGVNGESYVNIQSHNTNFALLVTVRLTDPLEDTIAYGRSIAQLATKLGGGNPIIQRFGDLLSGRRSTWNRIEKSSIEPTLKYVTPGDISMALPHRIVTDLIEALQRLDILMPGVSSAQTLLYAPEIKFYSVKALINKYFETSLEKVFVAGDGAGLSRGINVAAATGVLAARGILERYS